MIYSNYSAGKADIFHWLFFSLYVMFVNKIKKRKTMTDYHLFCLDITHRQDYIFNTHHLKTIVGISSIIDRLNNTETDKKLLNKHGFNDNTKSSDDFIYYTVRSEIG